MHPQPESDIDPLKSLVDRLSQSAFRRRFHLGKKERSYLEQKGMAVILDHAADFVAQRLAAAEPSNDGKQTPYRNHPVFIAQHATGTCCRSCLERWHHIPKGKPLEEIEQQYIVRVIEYWLRQEISPPL